jgi:hypothetical protein
MDKILDDMRKKYEYEQSNVNLFPANPKFDENELNTPETEINKSSNVEEAPKMDTQIEEQPKISETKMDSEEINTQEQIKPESIVEDQLKIEEKSETNNLIEAPKEEFVVQQVEMVETVNEEPKVDETNPSNLDYILFTLY